MITTATHDTKRGEDARTRLLALSEMPRNGPGPGTSGANRRPPISAASTTSRPPTPTTSGCSSRRSSAPGRSSCWSGTTGAIADFRARLSPIRRRPCARASAGRAGSMSTRPTRARSALFEAPDRAGLGLPGEAAPLRPAPRPSRHVGKPRPGRSSRRPCRACPDTYQGTEFWDFSFVDPDNRRPVDYRRRAGPWRRTGAAADLLARWQDGRVKQATLAALLADRTERPGFYAEAGYQPVAATRRPGRARHRLHTFGCDDGDRRPAGGRAAPRVPDGAGRELVGRGLRRAPRSTCPRRAAGATSSRARTTRAGRPISGACSSACPTRSCAGRRSGGGGPPPVPGPGPVQIPPVETTPRTHSRGQHERTDHSTDDRPGHPGCGRQTVTGPEASTAPARPCRCRRRASRRAPRGRASTTCSRSSSAGSRTGPANCPASPASASTGSISIPSTRPGARAASTRWPTSTASTSACATSTGRRTTSRSAASAPPPKRRACA